MESAERVQDEEGRQYHIGLAPGEVAPWILLVGDPDRAARVAERFDSVRVHRKCREYVSFTGQYQGLEVTALGTGIGCDNTEIAVVELLECVSRPTLIRIGSCGTLQPEVALGELCISTGAVRLESTSLAFVEEGYPAVAHYEVVLALVSAAAEQGAPHHVGLTATASGFYGWQGRGGHAVTSRFPDLAERLGQMRVLNMEMEASTLFTLAGLAGLRAGAVCTVFANRPENRFIGAADKTAAESRAIEVGLGALPILARMDRESGAAAYHLPPA